MHPIARFTVASLAVVASGCLRPEGAHQPFTGKELFRACTSCHGDQGLGNPAIQAPAIAGLPDWYVEAQLTKFRTGVRGAHPDDIEGLRMRPMSRQLMNHDEVVTVSKYVAQLAHHKAAPEVKGGDASAGAGSYAVCVACHGDKGQGNVAMKAPPIAQLPDWYMLSQLKKFKAGIRGTNPADVTGAQMRAMSMTVADEQAMKNVVAYVSTFSK
jgi:cytochrome c553